MPTLTLNPVFSNRTLHVLAYFSPPYTTHTQLNYEIIFSLFHSDSDIWLKYCRNGLNPYSINQSIKLLHWLLLNDPLENILHMKASLHVLLYHRKYISPILVRFTAVEKKEFLIVPHLLLHGTLLFVASFKGMSH